MIKLFHLDLCSLENDTRITTQKEVNELIERVFKKILYRIE